MIATVLPVLLLPIAAVDLYRGAALQSGEVVPYYACGDTCLDRAKPNSSFGMAASLFIGKEKSALIKFGDLDRALGANAKILEATLVLPIDQSTKAGKVSLRRVTKEWVEGSGTGDAVEKPDPRSTTWSYQIFDPAGQTRRWRGGEDAALKQASGTADLAAGVSSVAIEGLAGDLAEMLADPTRNYGWLIEFDGEAVISSSESLLSKPTLKVRYVEAAPPAGPDLCITSVSKLSSARGSVVLAVEIKNVGAIDSSGYEVSLSRFDESLAKVSSSAGLKAGASTTVNLTLDYRPNPSDHRTQAIRVAVRTESADPVTSNNSVVYYPDGKTFVVSADASFASKCSERGVPFETWLLQQFRVWNDTYLTYSRFSIARDGARLRVNLGSTHADGVYTFSASDEPSEDTVRRMIASLTHQMGVPSFSKANFQGTLPPSGFANRSGEMIRSSLGTDAFAGVMGAGDTRNEALVPGQLPLPRGSTKDVTFESGIFVATKLYSLTDVAAMHAIMEGKDPALPMPRIVLVRAVDANAIPISEGRMSFFQLHDGEFGASPEFELEILGDSVMLPNRTASDQASTPFGRLGAGGENGAFLVKLEYRGNVAYGFLKAWELIAAHARGSKSAYVHEISFNITHMPYKPGNLALRKIAIDSKNSPPSQLSNLLDGDFATSFVCDTDWIEIDLGRDRPIGEIRLYIDPSSSPRFWPEFDILVYSTGQTVSDARTFASERSLGERSLYAFEGREDRWCLSYRGRPVTVRFLRLVRKAGGDSKLFEIEVKETEPPR